VSLFNPKSSKLDKAMPYFITTLFDPSKHVHGEIAMLLITRLD
jgi:hypothetical protein